jgi:hypothetical protein
VAVTGPLAPLLATDCTTVTAVICALGAGVDVFVGTAVLEVTTDVLVPQASSTHAASANPAIGRNDVAAFRIDSTPLHAAAIIQTTAWPV